MPANYTGVWIYYFSNGQKKFEAEYRNGIRHGKWTGWSADGELAFEGSYKNGVFDGVCTFHFGDGDFDKVTYWNGVPNGQRVYSGGHIRWTKYLLYDAVVTKQEYLAACAKDPTLPKLPEETKQDSKPAPEQK